MNCNFGCPSDEVRTRDEVRDRYVNIFPSTPVVTQNYHMKLAYQVLANKNIAIRTDAMGRRQAAQERVGIVVTWIKGKKYTYAERSKIIARIMEKFNVTNETASSYMRRAERRLNTQRVDLRNNINIPVSQLRNSSNSAQYA